MWKPLRLPITGDDHAQRPQARPPPEMPNVLRLPGPLCLRRVHRHPDVRTVRDVWGEWVRQGCAGGERKGGEAMTESEWQTCDDPRRMLAWLTGDPRERGGTNPPVVHPTPRKLRLFAVACCRSVWHLLTDERSRRAVEVTERYADGLVNVHDLETAGQEAWRLTHGIRWMDCRAEYMAWWATGSPYVEQGDRIVQAFVNNHDPQLNAATVEANIIRHVFGNPWRPVGAAVCPGCDGKRTERYCDAAGDMDDRDCSDCGGKGLAPRHTHSHPTRSHRQQVVLASELQHFTDADERLAI